jgi:FG-GAP repeat protein
MKRIRILAFVGMWTTACWIGASASGQTPLVTYPGASAGDRFGRSTAAVGDVDGDGWEDFAVGAPLNDAAASNAGAVTVRSGRTQQVLHQWTGSSVNDGFGSAIAAAGDIDLDGKGDVLVGASQWVSGIGAGYAIVFSGATGLPLHTFNGTAGSGFGHAVAGGGDIDGDTVPDLLVGAPFDSTGATTGGAIYLFSGASGAPIRSHVGTTAWAYFGYSVLIHDDVDGDGMSEYAAGHPTLQIGSPLPTGVDAFWGATGAPLWSAAVAQWNDEYGWALARLADTTGDGVDEVLAGAPQDPGIGCACNGKGFTRLLDGATGAMLYQVNGTGSYTGLGFSLAAAGDVNGNGVEDFAVGQPGTEDCGSGMLAVQIREGLDGTLILSIPVAGGAGAQFGFALASMDANGDGLRDVLCGTPCENAAGVESGSLRVYTCVRRPTVYCEAQLNSLGCLPWIQGVGTPSATLPLAFRIKAHEVLSNKPGILMYGFTPQRTPFLGGSLCVLPPIKRTPGQNSGGNPPPVDCSGNFGIDFNERIRSGVDPLLIAGEEIFAQYWSRDAAAPSTSNLTDAIGFFINP